ncbi:MAG: tRNA dimethylallyltransferase [Alphaproteobacteria bacterium MarineAlpha9_Bin4]|nr:tRNA (adenosine(37)-N6)-dimethylallyltransferase MiaA [Pelagibacterales bacterium]PPR25977.1 MAG: tRNA dimethylallyltransferase [Alphaproteobacteria bacterium MarineAlpha9_Bin4]
MESKLYKKKIIILIGGPTASGKSKLAITLAKNINGEIINADSMQIYRNFPILTSQPSKVDREIIKHHLYGYVDTNVSYNGSRWLKDSLIKIKEIFSKKKTPIVVGGTGLYLEFMSQGISIIPNISIKTKTKVKSYFENKGLKNMYSYLRKIDSEYSKKINFNDKIRITRALEVFFETNKTFSHYHEKKKFNNHYNYYKIFVSPSKEQIIENCILRFNKMIKQGVIEEFLKNKNKVKNCNISKAIGFQELEDHLLNKSSLLNLSTNIIKNTRKYSKRQFTWFNNRYNPQIKIDSHKKYSLILESLSKII